MALESALCFSARRIEMLRSKQNLFGVCMSKKKKKH